MTTSLQQMQLQSYIAVAGVSPGYQNIFCEGPSLFVQNLVQNMYIEGLDPPSAREKLIKQNEAASRMYSRPKRCPFGVSSKPSKMSSVPNEINTTPTSSQTPGLKVANEIKITPVSPKTTVLKVPDYVKAKSPTQERSITPPVADQKKSPRYSPKLKTVSSPKTPPGPETNFSKEDNLDKYRKAKAFYADKSLTGPRSYSNDMNDSCKHQCAICGGQFGLTTMRTHSRTVHNMSVREYQYKHGNIRENMSRIMWHKCQLCQEDFLLDSDEVHKHANSKHKMSLKEYNTRFLISAFGAPRMSKDAFSETDIKVKEEKVEVDGGEYGFMNL